MLPICPSSLDLAIKPTPLQLLRRVSEQLHGPRIWVKRDDLTGSAVTGNKVRKLEYICAQALNEGADTLITCGGLQSNHCRATALVGARLGMKVHLILRGEQPDLQDGNLLLAALCGASYSCYPADIYAKDLSHLLDYWRVEAGRMGRKPFVIPTGGSDGIGLWGYASAALELMNDFSHHQIRPDYVICATGSGGTQTGLALGFHSVSNRQSPRVVGVAVCDNSAYFADKAQKDLQDWQARYCPDYPIAEIPIVTNDSYIGAGYALANQAVLETIAWVAREEGIVLDPVYTGKAFYGLVSEIRAGAFADSDDIVFVHTGGVFGLFPYRVQLSEMLKTSGRKQD